MISAFDVAAAFIFTAIAVGFLLAISKPELNDDAKVATFVMMISSSLGSVFSIAQLFGTRL